MSATSPIQRAAAPAAAWILLGSAPALGQTLYNAYDNTGTAPTFGYSSNLRDTYYGDVLELTRSGILGSVSFSLYNGQASSGTISGGAMRLSFYDASGYSGGPIDGLKLLGKVTVPLDMAANPLAPGNYVIQESGNIASLNIAIRTPILITQQFEMTSGTSTRFGVASGSAATVGGSQGTYFLSNAQNGPGLFTGTSGRAVNPFYKISTYDFIPVPEPESYAAMAGFGLVAWAMCRRRSC